MQIAVLLNRGSGTMRSLDPEAVRATVAAGIAAGGHSVTVDLADGTGLRDRVDALVAEGRVEAVVVGGGDGTVSSAAGRLAGSGIALGVIPLGTMNLFARSLGMPTDPEEAAAALARARVDRVDIADISGRSFTHQVSFGIQPRMAKVRSGSDYGSRAGKILATARALMRVFRRPVAMHLDLRIDGELRTLDATGLVVSNGAYGSGHLPFADDPADGRLGVYACTSADWKTLVGLTTDVVRGTWRDNPAIEAFGGARVEIDADPARLWATIDGELEQVTLPAVIGKRRLALSVLRPA